MSMWLYDDVGEMEDFQNYQKEVRLIEREYLEIRVLLRDAEEDLRADPESEYLQAKVKYMEKRLKDLESQAARLAADHPLEISLFAPPHGQVGQAAFISHPFQCQLVSIRNHVSVCHSEESRQRRDDEES